VLVVAVLVVALACLVLGVLFASTPWLIGSLVASVVAALMLYRRRSRVVAARTLAPPATVDPAPVATAMVTGTAFAGRDTGGGVAVAAPSDLRVWVVDGRPGYHLGQCPLLDDLPSGVIPERVPLSQALEDGFVPCPTCAPSEDRLVAGSAAAVPAASATAAPAADEVWVVDGRPRYHRPDCAALAGQPGEAISYLQAVEDGFVPCSICLPPASR
jgi:hypothetical protein